MSVFERSPDKSISRGERTLIALPELVAGRVGQRAISARFEEASGLAEAIGLAVAAKLHFKLRTPKPATLFGAGQVNHIADIAAAAGAGLVIVDSAITPIQQKNLEKAIGAKVIDRTGLILEIFGERAATAEGRLQVELAHLDYQAGRLVRSWTHLERQRGGFGFLGGPGETQIEADRRLIRDRMAKIRKDLAQVARTRGLHRARRQRAPWPVVALVGYTNAGKSTLFNRLAGADAMAEDLLFATLDPAMREMSMPGFAKAIVSDTVGFISDLPTQLVAAFRATLEEVVSADLIIHVRDISHPDSEVQKADVEHVLREIGALGERGVGQHHAPLIEAWNKIDRLDEEEAKRIRAAARRREDVVAVSALSGLGIETLLAHMADTLRQDAKIRPIVIPASEGRAIAWLHAHAEIVERKPRGSEILYRVRITDADWARFRAKYDFATM